MPGISIYILISYSIKMKTERSSNICYAAKETGKYNKKRYPKSVLKTETGERTKTEAGIHKKIASPRACHQHQDHHNPSIILVKANQSASSSPLLSLLPAISLALSSGLLNFSLTFSRSNMPIILLRLSLSPLSTRAAVVRRWIVAGSATTGRGSIMLLNSVLKKSGLARI
jgi:hypothetical protein